MSGDLPYRYDVRVRLSEFGAGESEAYWATLRRGMAFRVQLVLMVMPQPPCDYQEQPVPWCDLALLKLREVRLLGGTNFSLWFDLPSGYPDIGVWPFAEFEGEKITEIGWTP